MDNVTRLLMQSSGGKKDSTYIDDVFSTLLWSGEFIGNAGTTRQMTNGVDLAGEGGLVWIKQRNQAYSTGHQLYDTVRGAGAEKELDSSSNASQGAGNIEAYGWLNSFDAGGFTTKGGSHDSDYVNRDGVNYASWTFRKQKGFFDIVTWSGNSTGGRQIAHNLGSVPGCIMIKNTNNTQNWQVYHRGIGAGSAVFLDLNYAKQTGAQFFNNTEPTATHFTLGTDCMNNCTGYDYIAYVFAGGASTEDTARSVDFDGNDGLSATSSDLVLGTGDFTVECWFKYDAGNTDRIISMDKTSNPTNKWLIYHHNGSIRLNINGSDVIFMGADNGFDTNNTDNWYHLALVKSSNSIKLYLNGVADPTTVSDSLDYQSDQIHIGMNPSGGENFDGLISNVRVVAGTAVYTSSFRPPIETLKNITNTKLLCCNNSSATGSTVAPSSANTYSINVTASGSSAYTLSGNDRNGSVSGSDPTVTANVGDTLNFAVNASGHPFYIRVSNGGYNVSTPAATNQGTQSGTVSWTPNTAGTYYYQCGNHSGMIGTITINAASGSITASGDPTASTVSPFDDPQGFKFGEGGDQNIIKCGSYIGNGSDTGPKVHLGWEPQWVMLKRTDSTDNWPLYDVMRGITTAGTDNQLRLDQNAVEHTTGTTVDVTSTGFKITTLGSEVNANNGEYIYMCIRRPDGYVGKPPELGTDVFTTVNGANSTNLEYVSNFPVDFATARRPAASENWFTSARLMQRYYFYTNLNNAQQLSGSSNNQFMFDSNIGWSHTQAWGTAYQSWMWKRHAGFDVVAYKGYDPAGVRAIPHNLGKVPEMIWMKARDNSSQWYVYHKGCNGGTNPEQYHLKLNTSDAEVNSANAWADTAPTSTDWTVGDDNAGNGTYDYIAMLFASVEGISKVGSYSGSSSDVTINLGFTPRFMIVKAYNSASGNQRWQVMDTLRGMAAGATATNRIYLDDTQAQQAGPYVTSVSSTGITLTTGYTYSNTNNYEYIYYAHA